MNRLKLRQLEIFVEVYRRRKIATAAEGLFMTQSAVSIALKQLEQALGTQLFDRTTRTLAPTRAALDLLPVAERMLRDARTAENMFRSQAGPGGRLVLATTPTLALAFVPRLVRDFLEAHPGRHVDILDISPERFIAALLAGEADVGIGFPGQEDSELRQDRLVEDHLCLVALEGSPVLDSRRTSWKSLQSIPLALIRPGYGMRKIVDSTALRAGVSLNVSHEVDLLTTALAMCAAGLANTIAPAKLAYMPCFPGLAARRIVSPVVKRDIFALSLRNRSLSPEASLFVQFAIRNTRGTTAAT